MLLKIKLKNIVKFNQTLIINFHFIFAFNLTLYIFYQKKNMQVYLKRF